MALPPLTNWDTTAQGLHRVTQLVVGIRQWVSEPLPNFLHLTMQVEPDGLSTGGLSTGGSIDVNFRQAAVRFQPADGVETSVPVAGQTASSLFHALLKAMQAGNFAPVLEGVQDDKLVRAMLAAMQAKNPAAAERLERLADDTPLEINTSLANDYADVLYTFFTAVARFRARLNGHMTPVIVWPHHFDLSTLWFFEGEMDDQKSHINVGFAPFSEGFPRPYLYAYVHPYPPNVEYPPLPQPAHWNDQGWTGVIVNYDDIVQHKQPDRFIEQLCLDIFAALKPMVTV